MLLAPAIVILLLICMPAPAAAAAGRDIVTIADEAQLYRAPGTPAIDREGRPALEHGSAWVLQRRGDWLQIPTLHNRDGSRGWIRRTRFRSVASTRLLVRVDL